MKYLSILIISLFLLTLMQCGGSKLEDGDAHVANAKYTQAINSYLAHKKSNPETAGIDEKIALAYFKKGEQLFTRSHNIDAFSGNYEKALDYLDEDGFTPEQIQEYSKLLYDLAIAYRKTSPNNDIQKEQYFNNTLDYLQLAIDNDSQNISADSMLNQIYMENFQEMFDKGVTFYKRAKKERNNADLYLSAERYFKKAVQFNTEHQEAAKYLSNARKKTLGVLQNIHPLSFCVPNYKINKKTCFIAIAAKNFSNDPVSLDINALTLNTKDGQIINVDLKKTAELEKALKEKAKLKAYDLVEGQVVYTLEPNTEIEYIAYNNDEITVKKYFP